MSPYTPEWHRAYGLHSNIPECCVDFWLNVYLKSMKSPGYQLLRTYHNLFMKVKNIHWEYVPCPKCISTNNKKELHICNPNCVEYYDLTHPINV